MSTPLKLHFITDMTLEETADGHINVRMYLKGARKPRMLRMAGGNCLIRLKRNIEAIEGYRQRRLDAIQIAAKTALFINAIHDAIPLAAMKALEQGTTHLPEEP